MNRSLTRALLAAIALSATTATSAREVVEIRMRGRYFTEPATIRVTVAVEPDHSNRSLLVEADGDRLFRSSEVALEGEKGQRLHIVEFKNLPAGEYVLRAEVRSFDEVRGMAEEILVVGTPRDRR